MYTGILQSSVPWRSMEYLGQDTARGESGNGRARKVTKEPERIRTIDYGDWARALLWAATCFNNL